MVNPAHADLPDTIAEVQAKMVKVYGAGGFRGLEAYQSGFLVSEDGKIITAWSYVLDTDDVHCTLSDGRRFAAKLLGADAQQEIALLKIDATELPHFDLAASVEAEAGTPVLAFSNVFGVAYGDEAASVQHGVVAVKTELAARRGAFELPYRGRLYVLDAMTNNPGAAGGALTNYAGELIGVLGKEVRNAQTNTWLNFAIGARDIAPTIEKLASGAFLAAENEAPKAKPNRPVSLALLGIVTVPNVVERTPPYIDQVRADSVAARAGLRADDLIISVNERLVPSLAVLESELGSIDRADEIQLTVLRDQELIVVKLRAAHD
jgi:serine protease Do